MINTKKLISKETSASLSRAYMNLYKKLVNAYKLNGKTTIQSQSNAVMVLREIMAAHGSQANNNAIKFLIELNATHNKVINKKTEHMLKNKSEFEPIGDKGYSEVISAMRNFEQQIRIANIETAIAETVAAVRPHGEHIKTFYEWVNENATDADIEKLENDPRYFEKFYHKFAMRQKRSK